MSPDWARSQTNPRLPTANRLSSPPFRSPPHHLLLTWPPSHSLPPFHCTLSRATSSSLFVLLLRRMLCSRKVMNFLVRKDVRKILKRKDSDAGERGLFLLFSLSLFLFGMAVPLGRCLCALNQMLLLLFYILIF